MSVTVMNFVCWGLAISSLVTWLFLIAKHGHKKIVQSAGRAMMHFNLAFLIGMFICALMFYVPAIYSLIFNPSNFTNHWGVYGLFVLLFPVTWIYCAGIFGRIKYRHQLV